ncbi:PCNA-associated factor isoform X2 [Rhineura floridana]|uniref:PCNA-associated factor isoform X2 n=1 Tax=Rhineura floridana TaxID=261503 RepID=UPI002AC85F24|nr:PCNA-associated factor isoform X2 [Rhineura floridana]
MIAAVAGMARTKADRGGTGGAYRKVVAARAPRKVLGSGNANVGSSPASRKAESKYTGGNPVCTRPTPPWQKGIGEFFRQSPKHLEKENQVSEEPGCSGIGKHRRKARPLSPYPGEHEAPSEDEQM